MPSDEINLADALAFKSVLAKLLIVELAYLGHSSALVKESRITFWNDCDPTDSVLQAGVSLASTQILRPVFNAADMSHSRGWFVYQLFRRLTHIKALLAMLHGNENPVWCTHCVRTFTAHISINGAHFLYPSHTYRSLRGFWDSKKPLPSPRLETNDDPDQYRFVVARKPF
ncbi:hypothetical protein QQX98_010837 [Neonectria punicea]|uniref:C2H2-type domain-containing protein n=1 Tax=Neonectria punicea TaxID=979145 RepID=A0ABR1GNC7_9HYPO